MKKTAVEFLEEQLNKIKSSSTNMNTWVSFLEKDFKELFTQAKEIENQQRGYSDEEVLNFTQTIIQQYKLGNTNIEQLDLLKETLQQFKNKKFPQQEKNEEVDENKKNLYYQKQVMNPYPVEGYSYTAYEKGFIDGYYESTKWFEQFKKK